MLICLTLERVQQLWLVPTEICVLVDPDAALLQATQGRA